MGDVIRFPFERRDIWSDAYHAEPATVLILPTVRIERQPDWPAIVAEATEDAVRAAFDRLRSAFGAHGQAGDLG